MGAADHTVRSDLLGRPQWPSAFAWQGTTISHVPLPQSYRGHRHLATTVLAMTATGLAPDICPARDQFVSREPMHEALGGTPVTGSLLAA